MSAPKTLLSSALCAAFFAVTACQPGAPQTGSQTNWLTACDTADDCGGLECLCGICTLTCDGNDDCADTGGSCVPTTDAGAIALCDGQTPSGGMCLAHCDEDTACPKGASCVAGVCAPSPEASAHVSVDPETQHQTLIGFGASVAYNEDAIVQHPDKEALFDAMFSESGFEVLRFGNRFDGTNPDALQATAEIIAAAESRLGSAPTLFMTSGSPPPELKANGDRYCSNADADCTLVRDAAGGFDYAGFAEYWRTTLEAYETAGIHPDFVSIQNNTDWIPGEGESAEACRFLPQEGTTMVTPPEGEFPGFDQALAAVRSAVGDQYGFTAAEAGSPVMVGGYVDALAPADFNAVAFHLFGMDPQSIDVPQFESLRSIGEETGKPVIQSEMQADGLGTAILAHYSLTVANVAAYLQQSFAWPDAQEDGTLIRLNTDGFETLSAYHALAHFARSTDPGWVRVDAANDEGPLLSSAWLSPDEASLTIILVNPEDSAVNAEISAPAPFDAFLAGAGVTRTVFGGVERSADLGPLSAERVVRVPGGAMVTIAVTSN